MKNVIKYILILSICLMSVGCGKDTSNLVVYESPLSKTVDTLNTDIINKFNNAVEITVKYDMDKETDSFVDESIKDMENKGYLVSHRKMIESTRILSTTPDVLYNVVEYQIITYRKKINIWQIGQSEK